MPTKPHKGLIEDWFEVPFDVDAVRDAYGEDPGLGYVIRGWCIKHPQFGTSSTFQSSWIVKREGNEVETRNSRYTLGTPRPHSGVVGGLQSEDTEVT